MLKDTVKRYKSLKEARASLRLDGYCLSRFHWAGFGEVWTEHNGEHFAIIRSIPWFGLGVFVKLGEN